MERTLGRFSWGLVALPAVYGVGALAIWTGIDYFSSLQVPGIMFSISTGILVWMLSSIRILDEFSSNGFAKSRLPGWLLDALGFGAGIITVVIAALMLIVFSNPSEELYGIHWLNTIGIGYWLSFSVFAFVFFWYWPRRCVKEKWVVVINGQMLVPGQCFWGWPFWAKYIIESTPLQFDLEPIGDLVFLKESPTQIRGRARIVAIGKLADLPAPFSLQLFKAEVQSLFKAHALEAAQDPTKFFVNLREGTEVECMGCKVVWLFHDEMVLML